MNKKAIYLILSIITVAIFLYASFGFVSWELNAYNRGDAGRFLYLFLFILLIIPYAIIIYRDDSD